MTSDSFSLFTLKLIFESDSSLLLSELIFFSILSVTSLFSLLPVNVFIVVTVSCFGICGATISEACTLAPDKKKNPDKTATLATPTLYFRILYLVNRSLVFSSIHHFAFLPFSICFSPSLTNNIIKNQISVRVIPISQQLFHFFLTPIV